MNTMTIGEAYTKVHAWIGSLPLWVLLLAFAALVLLIGLKGIKWFVVGLVEEYKAKKAWRGPYWGKKPPSKLILKSHPFRS